MRVLLAGFGLMIATSVSALEVVCVDSVVEFDAAYRLGESDDVEIRMVTGTYDVASSCLDDQPILACPKIDNTVTIRGGYTANCSSRVADPAATVITNPGRALSLSRPGEIDLFDFAMDRLTVRDALEFNTSREALFSANYRLEFSRVWIDNVDRLLIDRDTVVIRDSIFSRSTNSIELLYSVDSLIFENNTVVGNTRGLLCNRCDGLASNNIFWNNSQYDIKIEDQGDSGNTIELALYRNLYQTLVLTNPLAQAPVGTITADPLFVSAATQNYRLQGASPAINAGLPLGGAIGREDHDGGTRWFGTAPDFGAYESAVGTTATTITVTNTNDSGAGSLRQAINDANAAPNLNRIEFAIGSTCGPRIINLATPLPTVTGPVVIDGYTQPGALRNNAATGSNAVRCIGLDGQGSVINGIAVGAADDVSVTIDGLGFGGFSLIALNLTGGNGHRLVGSQFGGQIGPTGNLVTLPPNLNAVQVGSLVGGAAAAGVEIGGDAAAERNVFSDSTDAAIRIGSGARNARVVNNYIGVGAGGGSGTEANRDGIVVGGRFTTILTNTISNNTRHGILVTGSAARATTIRDNRIGITATCVPLGCGTTFGNTEDGIRVEAAAADAVIEDNDIRYNGDDGVVITGDAVRVAVLRNRITDNGEQPVDLSDDGASQNTNNTAPAPPGSGNFRQNRPLLTSAIGTFPTVNAAGIASGSLTSSNGTYRIDFYAVVDCPLPIVFGSGSPLTWLGATYTTISNATTNFDGSAAFSGLIGVAGDTDYFAVPRLIAATATRLAASSTDSQVRSTSEVSSCLSYDARLLSDGFE